MAQGTKINHERMTITKAVNQNRQKTTTTIIKVAHHQHTTTMIDGDGFIDQEEDVWPAHHIQEYPIMEQVRGGITQYQLQSADHFSLHIDASQLRRDQFAVRSKRIFPGFKLEVQFRDFNSTILYRYCRFQPPKRKGQNKKKPSGDCAANFEKVIQVHHAERWISLREFLEKSFPIYDTPAGPHAVLAWWHANGKKFDWKNLPTEIKDNILSYCMHQIPYLPRRTSSRRMRAKHGPVEIMQKLGPWSGLLHVSHQVRALALRLCFSGDNSDVHGLALDCRSWLEVRDVFRRLSKFYAMTAPNGVPINRKTFILAENYRLHPVSFPELSQYSTLLQNVQRMEIDMGFLHYLQFFKVTVGGFQKYWRNGPTHETLNQLPQLKCVYFTLPDAGGRLENDQRGPDLFYEDFACPRTIHRFIYEKAADVLAHRHIMMRGFIDSAAEVRFLSLRDDAMRALKFTEEELKELYKDDGGGIELDGHFYPGEYIVDSSDSEDTLVPSEEEMNFWPPKCRCKIRCRDVVDGATSEDFEETEEST